MSFTLATLKTAIQDYADNSETSFVNNLSNFKKRSSVIVANRSNVELIDVKDKVFTRDIYMRD